MAPEQKIKWAILARIWPDDCEALNPENIDHLFNGFDSDDKQEMEYEFREGEVETGIPCDYSRHYESKAVAAKMPDGTWVGWTYWYGGGKHGEPEGIDWMDDAYNLDCKEEEKVVTVRTFTKQEAVQQ